MGWNYGMMNGNFGAFNLMGSLAGLIILIDLVLLGVWLWKQINKR